MIKERIGGKYVRQKQGTNKEYTLVGVSSSGAKSIVQINADSKPAAKSKAKEKFGFTKIVKGSVWQTTQFETRRALGANEATTEPQWKVINAKAKEKEGKNTK